jgi:hypothetical protein
VVAETQHMQFAGLNPVPISDDTLCAAAGLPPSPFIETLKPYRVLRHSAVSYELVLGPKGYGAAFLADRYRRAQEDPIYRQGLDTVRSDAALSRLSAIMQQRRA